jgi:alpha-L-fucosidase
MSKRNFFHFILLMGMAAFSSCSQSKGPTDAEGRPLIVKSGTIDCDMVETTPVVFKNRVYRFEYVRAGYWNNKTSDSYFRFTDHDTGKPTTSFGCGFHLGSAFVYNDSVYVTAVNIWDGEEVHIFSSGDLENWHHRLAFKLPGFGIFNTSLTRAEKKFVLMFEIGRPPEEAGERFTARFAASDDLIKWEMTSPDHNYAKDRYTAPHCLRYLEGYYYDFYLEVHEGYETRVVRSKDLVKWESSPLNPVLKASSEDKNIACNNLPEEMRSKISGAVDCNNSDIDFCEYNGKLVINYSWGNQLGVEFLAEASYAGTTRQFLKGWFPD